jgi:hypothetical protein
VVIDDNGLCELGIRHDDQIVGEHPQAGVSGQYPAEIHDPIKTVHHGRRRRTR